jgi:hypothetical protein
MNVFAAFVKAVQEAVAEAVQKPELAQSHALRSWQSKALPLLEKGDAAMRAAAAAFDQGNAQPILTQAEDKRGMAKDIEGFPLTFAGPEHAQKLEQLETAVVTAAYQICAAAGIP